MPSDRRPHSAAPGIAFPAAPGGLAARLLALQFQFSESERWPEAEIRALQFRQIASLVSHCHADVPFLRDRLAAAGLAPGATPTEENWARLPILTRRDVQEAGARLYADSLPDGHGKSIGWATSGSTGTPVEGRRSELSQQIWMAFNVRDLLWHPAAPDAKLAAIRRDRSGLAAPPNGRALPGWAPSLNAVFPTGPATLLDILATPAAQAEWLRREAPAHLASFPGVIALLARHCLDHGITVPTLRDVRTFGEVLPDTLRDTVRAAWGADLVDSYSAEEVGFVALQCPENPHYHVQSENLLVELLRDDGTPCAAGEVGRVIVTPLHNFAMPLLRYDLGDLAERGPPCPCGRTLPVLTRILGKTRHTLAMPDGSRRYTTAASKVFNHYPSIIQAQVAQTALSDLEIRMVARRRLLATEEAALADEIHVEMGSDFALSFVYMDELPRSPVGKFHTFRCEIQ